MQPLSFENKQFRIKEESQRLLIRTLNEYVFPRKKKVEEQVSEMTTRETKRNNGLLSLHSLTFKHKTSCDTIIDL